MEAYDDIEFSDDLRIQELQSVQSIYPRFKANVQKLSGSIDIPIKIEKGIEIKLIDPQNTASKSNYEVLTSHKVQNLPPITLSFRLPENYPYDEAPEVCLESSVLSDQDIQDLTKQLQQLWIDFKDQVLFNLIDLVMDKSQTESLHLEPDFKDPEQYYDILDYDKEILQQEFDMQTYTCEICQDDYKGKACSQFDCKHVFCNQCLYDFFSSVIKTGEVEKVHCPNFECTKKFVKTRRDYSNLETWMEKNCPVEEIVNTLLTPSISLALLTKILKSHASQEEVEFGIKRFQEMFKKSQYEFIGNLLPNRLVDCPRTGCTEVIFRKDLNDKLVVCPKCAYAFCNDCHNSWHARFVICKKLADRGNNYLGVPLEDIECYLLLEKDSYERKALSSKYGRAVMLRAIDEFQMDQLFNKMLSENKNVVSCPTCEIAIEKTDGCNKMKCSQCLTNFCFLCGEVIGPNYDHFSSSDSPCYKKLFVGMAGTEDVIDIPIGALQGE